MEKVCRSAIAAARRESGRAAAITSDGAEGWKVVVELAGDAPTVERDLAWLREEHCASDATEEAIGQIRDLQAEVPAPFGLRFRVGALASRLEPTIVELRARGASLLAYPGLQLVYASFALDALPAEREVEAIFGNVKSVARSAGAVVTYAKPRRLRRRRAEICLVIWVRADRSSATSSGVSIRPVC